MHNNRAVAALVWSWPCSSWLWAVLRCFFSFRKAESLAGVVSADGRGKTFFILSAMTRDFAPNHGRPLAPRGFPRIEFG